MLLSLVSISSYTFAQPATPVTQPLPMHLYQVEASEGGNGKCPQGTNFLLLNQQRLVAMRRYATLNEAIEQIIEWRRQ